MVLYAGGTSLAYHGAQRSISLWMPVPGEHGRIAQRQRKLDIRIPKAFVLPAFAPGRTGRAGGGEGPSGDLFLEIEFKPHARFRVVGPDVYRDLPLALWEAALGCSLTVPTPEGSVQLTIPAGSAAGRQLRLRGKGIPGKAPGDLYVVLTIVLPPAVSENKQAVYRAMAEAFYFNARTPVKG